MPISLYNRISVDESSKLLLTVALPTVTVLIGILINNRQIDQLARHMDAQLGSLRNEMNSIRNEMNSLRSEMNARFEAVNQAILRVEGVLDARLKQVVETLRLR